MSKIKPGTPIRSRIPLLVGDDIGRPGTVSAAYDWDDGDGPLHRVVFPGRLWSEDRAYMAPSMVFLWAIYRRELEVRR